MDGLPVKKLGLFPESSILKEVDHRGGHWVAPMPGPCSDSYRYHFCVSISRTFKCKVTKQNTFVMTEKYKSKNWRWVTVKYWSTDTNVR